MKLGRSQLAWSFAVLTCLTGAAVTVIGANTVQSADSEPAAADATVSSKDAAAAPEAGKDAGKEAGKESAASEAPAPKKEVFSTSAANSCLSDPVVLNEIQKKQQEIEQKQKDLATREAELKARETALNDEIKKLSALRDEISKLDASHRAENEEKIAKVVETLSTMSPKASATMLTNLDDALAVSAISQMDTVKLAKIMNVIDPKRASKLTELLAGVVRAKNSSASSDVAATTQSPQSLAKKGETNNDNKNESIISGGPEQVAQRTPSAKTAEGQ
jgi:flagellar motility protein MotE (MotC chaperone)